MSHIRKRGRLRPAMLATLIAILATGALTAQALAHERTVRHKEPLMHTAAVNCNNGAAPGPLTKSYIVLSSHVDDSTAIVAAKVKLRHADPETTYDVYLAQTPITPNNPTCYPGVVIGTIKTNEDGNGHGYFAAPRYSTTTGAFVTVLDNPYGGTDLMSTTNYVFPAS
jgi:hypothetical protein